MFWFVFGLITAFLTFDMLFLLLAGGFETFYDNITNFHYEGLPYFSNANSLSLYNFIIWPVNYFTFQNNIFLMFGYLYRMGYALPLLLCFILFSMILWKINARPSKRPVFSLK